MGRAFSPSPDIGAFPGPLGRWPRLVSVAPLALGTETGLRRQKVMVVSRLLMLSGGLERQRRGSFQPGPAAQEQGNTRRRGL